MPVCSKCGRMTATAELRRRKGQFEGQFMCKDGCPPRVVAEVEKRATEEIRTATGRDDLRAEFDTTPVCQKRGWNPRAFGNVRAICRLRSGHAGRCVYS